MVSVHISFPQQILVHSLSFVDGDITAVDLLAPAVTVGERRELWILPPFFFGLFFCL